MAEKKITLTNSSGDTIYPKTTIDQIYTEDGTSFYDKYKEDLKNNQKLQEQAIGSSEIASNAVTSDKIKDGSITSTKISNEAITSDKIKKGSINYDRLNANVMDNISKNITSGNFNVPIKNVQLDKNNRVDAKNLIQNRSISAKLMSSNFLEYLFNPNKGVTGDPDYANIEGQKLPNNVVSENNLDNSLKKRIADLEDKYGLITVDKNNLILSSEIKDSAVTTDKIKDSAVTTGKIKDSAVTTGKIKDSAVTTDKIKDSAVTTDKIKDSAVTPAKVSTRFLELLLKGGKSTSGTDYSAYKQELPEQIVGNSQIIDNAVSPSKVSKKFLYYLLKGGTSSNNVCYDDFKQELPSDIIKHRHIQNYSVKGYHISPKAAEGSDSSSSDFLTESFKNFFNALKDCGAIKETVSLDKIFWEESSNISLKEVDDLNSEKTYTSKDFVLNFSISNKENLESEE
jgi:trimeric autotransporter adhesin